MVANAAQVGPSITTATTTGIFQTPMEVRSLTLIEKRSPKKIKHAKTAVPTTSCGSTFSPYL